MKCTWKYACLGVLSSSLGLLENVLPESDAYKPKDVLHPLRCAGIISGVETTNN